MTYKDAGGGEWDYSYLPELYDPDNEVVFAKVVQMESGKSYVRGWKREKGELDVLVWIEMIRRSTMLFGKEPDEGLRRAYRVLAMVRELHSAGFQRLRIAPSSSPNGFHWRCWISTRDHFRADHGAMCEPCTPYDAVYSSASGNHYFCCEDAEKDTAKELAARFMQRYPELVEKGEGRDWEYAGWYEEMLYRAREGGFPIVNAESDDDESLRGFLPLSDGRLVLPMPPGGEWVG